jgi:hypothetical protein
MNENPTAAGLKLLKLLEGNNVPLTLNYPDHQGVVFVYSGDNWELFSNAIRETIDRVQENLLEQRKMKGID